MKRLLSIITAIIGIALLSATATYASEMVTVDNFERESPGPDKESNWLPAPDGPFLLGLRIYWPEQDILDGKWEPSPIEKAK